jgi:hypothetical protein
MHFLTQDQIEPLPVFFLFGLKGHKSVMMQGLFARSEFSGFPFP